MHKQSLNTTFRFLLHLSLILLISNVFLACNDKQKSDIREDDNTPPQSYLLSDNQQKEYPVVLKKYSLNFPNIKSPMLIVHLFDHTKNMAQTQIDMLTKIQNQFKSNVTIKHISVDNASNPENRDFLNQLQKHFNIKESNQLPLIVVYQNDQYYTHFEGDTPIEMVRYTLQTLLKK